MDEDEDVVFEVGLLHFLIALRILTLFELETCTGRAARRAGPERAGPKRAGLTNRQSGTGRAGPGFLIQRAGPGRASHLLDNW